MLCGQNLLMLLDCSKCQLKNADFPEEENWSLCWWDRVERWKLCYRWRAVHTVALQTQANDSQRSGYAFITGNLKLLHDHESQLFIADWFCSECVCATSFYYFTLHCSAFIVWGQLFDCNLQVKSIKDWILKATAAHKELFGTAGTVFSYAAYEDTFYRDTVSQMKVFSVKRSYLKLLTRRLVWYFLM